MTGRSIGMVWQGHRITAHVPDPLADLDLLTLAAPSTFTRSIDAARALVAADRHLPAQFAPLVLLLLRREGIASSQVEGIRASAGDVVVAELKPGLPGPATQVADNFRALTAAMRGGSTLTSTVLHEWHRLLMAGSPDFPTEQRGIFRDSQSWIGGQSPVDAAYVGPPAGMVIPLMEDLLAYANRTDLDPVAQAAVCHVQFESIHPYGDGNGRIGRILIGWILTHRLDLRTPPPVSVRIGADVGGYFSGMTLWRQGMVDPWLTWFARVVQQAARSTEALVEQLAELSASWESLLSDIRRDSVVHEIVHMLPRSPVLRASTVARTTKVSERTARDALLLLGERGILSPFTPSQYGVGRPSAWWQAADLLRLIPS